MLDRIDNMSPKNYARAAGVLYLIIIIFAGFSEGYIRSGMIAWGDPALTADNILTSKLLFRIGFAGDLIAFISDAIVAVLVLYSPKTG